MILRCSLIIIITILIIAKYRQTYTNLSNLRDLRDIRVYASFTSIPPRLNNTEQVIKNILKQTYPIEGIIFNIPNGTFKRTGEEYFVPEYLDKYKDIVKVVRCEEYGPGTKLMGGLEHIPSGSYIYVIDDDMHYPKNHLERLVSQLDYDTDVVSNVYCYNNFIKNNGVCGYTGFIVYRDILKDINKYYNQLPQNCFTVDDVWISDYLQKKKAKMKFGNKLDNIIPWLHARWKDDIHKDKTALFNTANKGNMKLWSGTNKNALCKNELNKSNTVS